MATFDHSCFPLVLTTWSENPDIPEVQRYFVQVNEAAQRSLRENTHYVTISTGSTGLSADLRKVIAEEVAKMPPELTERNLASFVIVTNPFIRGSITALRWISSHMETVYAVATFEEGVERAVATLKERGITLKSLPRAMPR